MAWERAWRWGVVAVGIVFVAGLSGASADEARRLTIRQAVQEALASSPELDTAEAAVRSARANAALQRGSFAPRPYIEGGFGIGTSTTAVYNVDDDGSYPDNNLRVATGLQGDLSSGTHYELLVSALRLQSDPQSGGIPTSLFSPSFTTQVQAQVTQQLLRGAWGVRREPAETNETEADALVQDRRTLRSALALATVEACWGLAVALESRRVATESVALAQRQLEATQLRIRAGRLSPLDETSAQATVAARQDALVAVEQAVIAAEAGLHGVLLPRARDRGEPATLEIAETPETGGDGQSNAVVRTELDRALAARTELKAQRLRLRGARRHAEALDHETLPELSVSLTAGLRGLAGTNPDGCDGSDCGIDPQSHFVGGIETSFANTVRAPYLQIAGRLAAPVPNTQANAAATVAALAVRQRESELARAEWTVRTQVRQAVLALDRARERVRTSGEALRLAEQSLEGEQRKFDAGVSTTFEVIRVQEALAAARNARYAAQAELALARARLSFARGTLLEDLGVD